MTLGEAEAALAAEVMRLENLADELDCCTDPLRRAELLARVNQTVDECNRTDREFVEAYRSARSRWDTTWTRAAARLPEVGAAIHKRVGPLLRILRLVSPLEADGHTRRPSLDDELDLAEREAEGDPDLLELVRSLREAE